MKKITITLVILLLLTSCVPETPPPPYGVWVSEEPQIILFFTPEYQVIEDGPFYFGIYTINGVDVKAFARLNPGGGGP